MAGLAGLTRKEIAWSRQAGIAQIGEAERGGRAYIYDNLSFSRPASAVSKQSTGRNQSNGTTPITRIPPAELCVGR